MTDVLDPPAEVPDIYRNNWFSVPGDCLAYLVEKVWRQFSYTMDSNQQRMEGDLIMKCVTIILAVALFLATFATVYSGTPVPLWTSLIMCVMIATLGYTKSYAWATVAA